MALGSFSRWAFVSSLLLLTLALSPVWAKNTYPANVTEIIRGYGYPCEDHLTEPTNDGWRLSLQRIPYGKNNAQGPRKGVVFFQHGLTDSSVGVNLNSPEESLSFILADAGYDVWMGNNRGNGVSTINVLYSEKSDEYWDFSWDEMALIDFPTQTAYVMNITGASKLTYIGHSEGTIQAFAGLSWNPQLASRFNLYIALAPVAYVQYIEAILIRALADLHVEVIYDLLGVREFDLPTAINKLLPGVCTVTPALCAFDLDLIVGPTTYLNKTREPYYLHFEPNPTSVKNMAHWAQCVRAGTFDMYDYGEKGNIEHYNQPTPPQYELSQYPLQTQLPTALFTGGNDYLADPKDVSRLISLLPSAPYLHTEANYGHLDPLIGYEAYQQIYPIILNLIDQAWNATSHGETLQL